MANNLLLQVKDLHKAYGTKEIFVEAEASFTERQKIGVVGRNGAGKTTLFKMIMGDEDPDSGQIIKMPDLRLGYIPQHDPFKKGEKVLDFLMRYTDRQEWECAKVAAQFGLKNERLTMVIGDLSGGYQMRVKLAATLLFEPNVLLLDEPTNYLDLSTLILLEHFLIGFRGSFLIITHDREFIKKTCDHTLDVENGGLFLYPRPLEEYLGYKEEQKELAAKSNKNIEAKQKQLQKFVDRFGAKASMAKSAKSKTKQIEWLNDKKINIAHPFSTVKMIIPGVETKKGGAFQSNGLKIGYPDKTIAQEINIEIEKGQKVAILGDNGQGKSTLLKTMAGLLDPLEGSFSWMNGLKVAYYAQHVNQALNPQETVEEYLRRVAHEQLNSEDIYKMLGNFLFKNQDTKKKIAVLSGGEKARLCLAGIFLSKSDVLLLDEPTNHLDFETVEAMGEALGSFNGTVVVVSHDRTFVNLLAEKIVEVKDGKVSVYPGTYEEYVWKMEQEATGQDNIINLNNQNQSGSQLGGTTAPQSKEVRKQLFNLKKEQVKIERKVAKLKESNESTELIAEQEKLWMNVQEQIEGLS